VTYFAFIGIIPFDPTPTGIWSNNDYTKM